MAQIHRFRDAVALSVGTGQTVYMGPKEARKIAKALINAARSVERETFAQSTCPTVSVDVGYQGGTLGTPKYRKQVRKGGLT